MVRSASHVRSRWMTNVQRSTKLLVGGVNTIIGSVTQSDPWNAFSVRGAADVVRRAGKWSGTVGFVFAVFAVLVFVTHPRIRNAKSALLAIKLGGRTCHGTICLVRSISTVALSITISAHRDAGSVVGTKEFVFSAIRRGAGRRFVRFIVAVRLAVADVSSADASAAVTFKLIGSASERRRLILAALFVFAGSTVNNVVASELGRNASFVTFEPLVTSASSRTADEERIVQFHAKWTQTFRSVRSRSADVTASASVHVTSMIRTKIVFLNNGKFAILNFQIGRRIDVEPASALQVAFLDPADAVGVASQPKDGVGSYLNGHGGSKMRPQDRLVFSVDADPFDRSTNRVAVVQVMPVEGHGRNHAVHLDQLFVPRAVHTPHADHVTHATFHDEHEASFRC